jgi:hypothetical protein
MNDLLAKLAVVLLLTAFTAVAEDKVPLKRDLPKPLEVGTPAFQGKLVDAKGVKGRYVRLYSNGGTFAKANHYIEVEVWGKPAA